MDNSQQDPVDRKYEFEATNPCSGSKHSHMDAVIFLAKDQAFLQGGLPGYRAKCVELGANPAHIESIDLLIARVTAFQANGESKVPDTDLPCEILRCVDGDMSKSAVINKHLTPDDINAVIVKEEYHLFDHAAMTLCVLTLKNGAHTTGVNYGAIDSDIQDWELSRRMAKKIAFDKAWELENYLLRQRLMEKEQRG